MAKCFWLPHLKYTGAENFPIQIKYEELVIIALQQGRKYPCEEKSEKEMSVAWVSLTVQQRSEASLSGVDLFFLFFRLTLEFEDFSEALRW